MRNWIGPTALVSPNLPCRLALCHFDWSRSRGGIPKIKDMHTLQPTGYHLRKIIAYLLCMPQHPVDTTLLAPKLQGDMAIQSN